MPEYFFTPEAKEDLKGVVRFTKDKWGNAKAVEYVIGLRKQASSLAQTPDTGKSVVTWKTA